MGQRITFRGSGSIMVSPGNFSIDHVVEPRLVFKKGWLTGGSNPLDGRVECGYGTQYPVPVTLSQLYEISHRVRDTAITAGDISFSVFGSSQVVAVFGSGPPTQNKTISYGFTDYLRCEHGVFIGGSGTGSADIEDVPQNVFGEAYLTEIGSGPFYDALNDERAIWYLGDSPSFGSSHLIETSSYQQTIPSSYGIYGDHEVDETDEEGNKSFGGSCQFDFGRRVAWVGGEGPFDPESSLWLYADISVTSFNQIDAVYLESRGTEARVEGAFEIELSNNDVISIPGFSSVGDIATIATPFRLKATKWWPYATTAGDPAWGVTTGLPVNGGPAA